MKMHSAIISATMAFAGFTAPVWATSWTVDMDNSSLGFSATQTGKGFDGVFETFTADIVFDPENLDAASVRVVVDMTSVDAKDRQRNDALPGKEWFNVKEHPTAVFTVEEFVATGDGAYEARGSLKMRDIEKPLTLPFSLAIEDGVASMSGETSLLRTDFGVGTGQWENDEWVGVDVKVIVNLRAVAAASTD